MWDVCLHFRLRRQAPGKGLPEQKKEYFDNSVFAVQFVRTFDGAAQRKQV